jgi:hypothetical protein
VAVPRNLSSAEADAAGYFEEHVRMTNLEASLPTA